MTGLASRNEHALHQPRVTCRAARIVKPGTDMSLSKHDFVGLEVDVWVVPEQPWFYQDGVVAKQRKNSEVLYLTEVLDHDLLILYCHDGPWPIRQCHNE